MALIDNLISYWKLDESSGDAVDAHGSNTLTEHGTGGVGSAAGIINNARDFESADSDYFDHTDNADLSTGDIDFTFQAWVKLESKTSDWVVLAKWEFGTNKEYRLGYDSLNDWFDWRVRDASGNEGLCHAATGVSAATWYHIIVWHDSVNNEVGIAINAGTAVTSSYSFGCQDSTAAFRLGSEEGGAADFYDGLIDEVGFWKRVLTSGERTSLYNGGAGFAYPFSTGGGVSNIRRR